MHWLPLVAMVIASALFFPHCPGVPRLVDATMEPGINFSNRSLVNPISKSSDSHAEYISSEKNAVVRLPRRTTVTNAQTDPTLNGTSFISKDISPERRQNQNAMAASMDAGLQTLSRRKNFHENHIPRDYTAGIESQEDSKLETHIEGDEAKENELKMNLNEEERLTFKEWPRDRYPADRLSNQDDLRGLDGDRTRGSTSPTMPPVPPDGLGLGLDGLLQVDDELLLLDTNPRVLFSTSPSPPKHPPLQIMLELGLAPGKQEEDDEAELKLEQEENRKSYRNLLLDLSDSTEQSTPPPSRRKRQIGHTGIERSVCESTSSWVMDRRTAIDVHMQNVTVLEKFPTKKGMMTQYFYETRCRGPDHRGVQAGEHGLAGGGCLGVDKRHWVSECQTKQSYVRAFTSDNTRGTGWRWIRIDTSCVCVLYSRTQKIRALTTRHGTR